YIASRISNALHLLSDKEYDAITSTLAALGFERIPKIDPKSLESILRHDKKGSGESIRYVLLKAIGQAEIQEISLVKLMEYYHDLR
ncbi:MAG: hypothetical protein U1C33_05465, partial [Candidatus Cloacimonadaceae bacterium]|nr:hypothetical protein [Candidatus Cloacimonadaceae bacterium]